MITVLYIALVFLLVFANGFFVASEFALVGVRRSRVEMLAQSGHAGANDYCACSAIAGFLMAKAGRVLHSGDEIKHDTGVFRVEKVNGRQVQKVRFLPQTRETVSATHALIPLLSLLSCV